MWRDASLDERYSDPRQRPATYVVAVSSATDEAAASSVDLPQLPQNDVATPLWRCCGVTKDRPLWKCSQLHQVTNFSTHCRASPMSSNPCCGYSQSGLREVSINHASTFGS